MRKKDQKTKRLMSLRRKGEEVCMQGSWMLVLIFSGDRNTYSSNLFYFRDFY